MNDCITIWMSTVYIESNIQNDVSYEKLARECGISYAYLREVFARTRGIPIVQYINQRRLSNAAADILYSEKSLTEIAMKYGFTAYDTFTRAFRRMAGMTPKEFRKKRPTVSRICLAPGVFGVSIVENVPKLADGGRIMSNDDEVKKTVLYGVPKAGYGVYGCTPFPICLKSCANYMGIDIDYEDTLVVSGAAFRMNWNVHEWDGGNVDAMLTYDSVEKLFINGFHSIGIELNALWKKDNVTKRQFFDFIKKEIDEGTPCIALGIIGPPEACIITGYDDEGEKLYGWNFFQDYPDCAAGISKDDNGYFITDKWWENPDTIGVFGLSNKSKNCLAFADIIKNAIEIMKPGHLGDYAKGIAGIDAWREAIANDAEFDGMIMSLVSERLMCHCDALDCLSDGRGQAFLYFKKKASEMPELHDKLMSVAGALETTMNLTMKMYEILGGIGRGEEQIKKLAEKAVREETVCYIDKIKASEEKTLELLKELYSII